MRKLTTHQRLIIIFQAILIFQVVAAAVGMTIVVGLVFGALPAWRASQVDPAVMLREE